MTTEETKQEIIDLFDDILIYVRQGVSVLDKELLPLLKKHGLTADMARALNWSGQLRNVEKALRRLVPDKYEDI